MLDGTLTLESEGDLAYDVASLLFVGRTVLPDLARDFEYNRREAAEVIDNYASTAFGSNEHLRRG